MPHHLMVILQNRSVQPATHSRWAVQEMEGLIRMLDMDASGTIDYEEFLAATMSVHQTMKEVRQGHARHAFARGGACRPGLGI